MPALPRPVRSAYQRQVERIAPPQLLGRDAELAELAAFCLDEQRGPYVWWRAGPWAGKSALLSTFVLRPPSLLVAGRVQVVSFFITARLASQDTRQAFTNVLTEQLCALLGQELPVGGDEAARETALLDLLARAAAACQHAGGCLVLVVDGLDEDRGVTTGPAAHSIAGLLPGQPPAGMRVIVAGRPNPPIPDDVPDWHPLRDPGIIRLLGDSPHARDLQRLGVTEIKRLLAGSPVEQDLLGLLTAARGGLSGPDLRELTGANLVAVEEILHTVAGRTFTRRLASWIPDNGPQVYLLGHEELHNAASHYLGPDRLDHYRDRLHTWAEGYRTPCGGRTPWPPNTPEYLLTGYPRMLDTIGDTDRLAALAVDAARHDRMLDLSGGDTAALTEIKSCQDLLLGCSRPDLYALARLSHHRSQLESRNTHIPGQLPAVWAVLGRFNRSEALARAITDPDQQARALAKVAEAVANAGDHERAAALAVDAEQIARTITDPDQEARALAKVAGAVSNAGDHERAERIVRAITDPDQQARALAKVAGAVSNAGDQERAAALAVNAERIARTADPDQQARALAKVAEAAANAGDHKRAVALAVNAERIARTTNSYLLTQPLAEVAGAVAKAGDHERAEQIARTVTALDQQAWALTEVARAAAKAGDHERAAALTVDAEQIARTLTDPDQHAWVLAEVAEAVAKAGDHERAAALAVDAEQIARTITNPDTQARVRAEVAEVVAKAGDHKRAAALTVDAEQIARTIDPDHQAWPLAEVAEAVAKAGDHKRAERIARTITHRYTQTRVLAEVARAVAKAGDHKRAEQIARTNTDPDTQARVLAEVVEAAAKAGDHERAAALAVDAERIARTIFNPDRRAWALVEVAGAVAKAGDHERAAALTVDAEQIARTTTDPYQHASALAKVAEAVAKAGDHERAAALTVDAERIARTTDPDQRAWALVEVAEAATKVGDRERAAALAVDAEQIARTITDPGRRAWALAEVAKVVGLQRASHLLGEAFTLGSWLTPLPVLAKIRPQEMIRIADAVYRDDRYEP